MARGGVQTDTLLLADDIAVGYHAQVGVKGLLQGQGKVVAATPPVYEKGGVTLPEAVLWARSFPAGLSDHRGILRPTGFRGNPELGPLSGEVLQQHRGA